jgi:hypothetical protein
VTALRFSETPIRHAEASRLALRVAQAIVARKRGWSLDQLSVSRCWNTRVGRTRWTVQVYVSFFFETESGRGPGAIYGVYFETKGTADEDAKAALVNEVATRLGDYRAFAGGLALRIRDTRPKVLLGEMDRLARAFGSSDSHRAPRSRAKRPDKRLTTIAETVLAHRTWSLETPMVRLFPSISLCGWLSAMPAGSTSRRPGLSTMLWVIKDAVPHADSLRARAESCGYVERAGDGQSQLVLMKDQPLSLRTALVEARFLETQVLGGR